MKIKLLILILFPFIILAQSQGLAVQSFKKLSSDLDARVNYPKTDQNGEKCAIIKVVTTQKGFSWEGDALGIVKTEYKVGEYWLYVPHGARRLTVKHEKLGVLRNYVYPHSIKEATVYELVLKSGNARTIVEDIEIPTQWLVISSKPDSALVYINDVYKGETTFQQELPLGKYTYRVEYPMYHSMAGVIILDTIDQNRIIDIELKKSYGSIALISNPENGAKVIIDGKDTGLKTPCTIDYLQSGEHTVSLRHKWYDPITSKVTINDEQEEKLTVSMEPNFGEVKIFADKESEVYVDGEYKGNGVWKGRMLTGIHAVRISKDSHKASEKKINVSKGEYKDVSVNLVGKYGKLKVVSEPYGAKISLNGLYKGNSPVSVSKLLIGDYTLLIEKEGFSSVIKHIKIEEEATLTINEKLP
ncbi:MAG: PEGA domain-containing protein, partial [Bacteroidales bacterium]|nr:PEGA domain-containing protein [Bacteroidales bacterium]